MSNAVSVSGFATVQMAAGSMPFVITEFYGWLVPPEYFHFWNLYGKNNAVLNAADHVMAHLPCISLRRVTFDVAAQSNVKGYVYWSHTHLDYRTPCRE